MRFKYAGTARDGNGRIIASATVSVVLTGTSTVASVYTSKTSTTAVNSVTSESNGSFAFWHDAFDYDSDQLFDYTISKSGFTSKTYSSIKGNVITGTYTISTAKTTTSAFSVPKGVLFVKATGGSLTFNGSFENPSNGQCFVGFTGADVVFGPGAIDAMRPEWFATNTTPGTTDMHGAFEKAVASMFASGVQTLMLSSSRYYFANLVEIANELQDIRITGQAIAGYISGLTGPLCEMTGIAGLSTLFLVSANQIGFELDHVRFNGDNITTGVGSAVKFTSMGYPARPVNIHHNFFTNFAKAIYSSPTAGGVGTGIAQVNIRENTFYANDYALYGDNNIGAFVNLNFVGNVSEQGGKIRIISPNIGGTLNISDNLLEGQADPIRIGAGLLHATIERNGFENCSGDIVNFQSNNSGSSLTMGKNYYTNMGTSPRVTVNNSFFNCTDRLDYFGINLNCDLLNAKSNPMTNKFIFAATPATTMNAFNPDIVRDQFGLPAALGGVAVSAGNTLVPTVLGMRGAENITASGTLYQITGSLAIGDFIVVTALIRAVDCSTMGIALYSDALAEINSTTPIAMSANGEFVLMHFALKATATSTGHYHFRFIAAGGATTAVLTDFYVSTATAPTGATAYYAYLPMLEAAGQATIALNGTSIVVTHGMGVTPRNVIVIPGVNVGYVWVDTIGATEFTINCSSNSHAETTVYWRAN